MADVTQVLAAIEAGDPAAAGELLPLVYDELRKLAAARMPAEAPAGGGTCWREIREKAICRVLQPSLDVVTLL